MSAFLTNWLGGRPEQMSVTGRVVNPGTWRPLLRFQDRDPRQNSEAVRSVSVDLPPGYFWTGNQSPNGALPPGKYAARPFVSGPFQLAGLAGRGRPTTYIQPNPSQMVASARYDLIGDHTRQPLFGQLL